VAFRLGIDVGGTFTDATLINEKTGNISTFKVSSTPSDPSAGFLEAVHRAIHQDDVDVSEIDYVIHGTTVATNAIIEGKTARTGFITTEGFRDMLEIARQTRPSLYDLQFEKPPPLVPRYLCAGVPERLDGNGKVLVPLDESELRRHLEEFRREGVESVAVCFLHAYANAIHEQRAGELLGEVFPEAAVSLSSQVAPEFREYLRASTTVINACVRPIVARYLESIEARLRQEHVEAELLVMQSSGGVYSFGAASEKPVFMVESGPAAGVISAAYIGDVLGHKNIISFDMGGTTAKTGLVRDGTPSVARNYEVGSTAQAGAGASRGSGYPIHTPVIDLVEIGAGGGSVGWVDSGGILRVGPQSAGADPGPVCYGWGGEQPTVTDANLVLGRLNPDYFLGGEIRLDVEAARDAIAVHCAEPLKMDIVEAAHGIVEIANAAMTNALRLVSVQRGYDPRNFVLVAFGGAGPTHANRLAAEIEIPITVIPFSPGTTSAMGLLVTDLKHEYATTLIQNIDELDLDAVRTAYGKLKAQGLAALEREGVKAEDMNFLRQADLRYVGQSYELTLALTDDVIGSETVTNVVEQFHREHDRAYGFNATSEKVEFVSLRLTAQGKIAKPRLRRLKQKGADPSRAQKETRNVYFGESGGFVESPIYDRYALGADARITGPAIIEEIDSTTVIHPGFKGDVDAYGNVMLTALT
jgi:N-methylhydantoinase A